MATVEEQKQPMKDRKALLIGITYQGSGDEDLVLRGPHRDVHCLRALLLKHGYTEGNIIVMLDEIASLQNTLLVPTRANIERELDNLVKGARRGDHFLFHFSGHSIQVAQSTDDLEKELDSKDEAILPVDHNDSTNFIRDNELNRRLIKPLPPGSHLVAILDTCHSATLLDLPHRLCNARRFYISEDRFVKTKQSTSSKTSIDVQLPSSPNEAPKLIVKSRSSSMKSDLDVQRPLHMQVPRCASPEPILRLKFGATGSDVVIVNRPRRSSADLNHRSSAFSINGGMSPTSPLESCFETIEPVDTPRMDSGPSTSRKSTTDSFWKKASLSNLPSEYSPYNECTWDHIDSPTERPHVIAISSSKDHQGSLEDPDGISLTMMLIDILEKDTRPRLKAMIQQIAQRYCAMSEQVFNVIRQQQKDNSDGFYRRNTEEWRKTFSQQPQISSMKTCHQWEHLEILP